MKFRMVQRLKKLHSIMKKICYLNSVIKCYDDSLVQGKYYLFDNFRSMSVESEKEQASIYFGRTESSKNMSSITKKLNQIGYFKNRNKKTTAEYEAFYSANNFDKVREVKLFSFRRRKILTICTSPSEAEKQILEQSNFSCAYNMPMVEKKERYSNSFEISMVDIKPIPGDADALKTILDCTVRYNISPENLEKSSVKKLVDFSYDNQELNLLLGSISQRISSSVLNCEIPLCMQHGDLSKDNLIYGESDGTTGFWWIDWEHADNRMFLYDFFFYIINSAVYYDTKAFECYMRGELDEALRKYFEHFHLEFIPSDRKDWLLIFMIDFLKERVCEFGRVEALKMYCNFIDEHIGEKNET